jgi:hypothetical protein
VYTRAFQQEELLVICNFSRKERTFTPPQRFNGAKPLVSNEEVYVLDGETVVGPFGTAVYHRA